MINQGRFKVSHAPKSLVKNTVIKIKSLKLPKTIQGHQINGQKINQQINNHKPPPAKKFFKLHYLYIITLFIIHPHQTIRFYVKIVFMLVFACISPHPPIILPTVGSPDDREKVKSTISALERLGTELAEVKPDTIIISSPHADWGINVPLFFLARNFQFPISNFQSITNSQLPIPNYGSGIFPILTTADSPQQHYEWGKEIIKKIPDKLRVAWIASGDMSHVLKEDGPYGFHPSGPKFDREFIERLKKKDIQGILNMDPQLIDKAGVCGLWSFCMMLGALEESKQEWKPEILSYEGPFGVGYLVANIRIK